MITDEEAKAILKKHIRVSYEVYTGKASSIQYINNGLLGEGTKNCEENKAIMEWLGKPVQVKNVELVEKYGWNKW